MNQSGRPFWHHMDAHDVLREIGTDAARGLDGAEVAQRLAEYGANELIERDARGVWRIVWEQLSSTMVVILIVAALISAFLGDAQDTVVILAIVALNAALGISQEYRAERAMAALKQLAVPMVRVRRADHVHDISARDLVPGDIVLLEAGNRVPADGRVLHSASLRVQEAALTGESVPIDKITERLTAPDLPLGDRRNMVYMGTVVTYGRGQFVVTATGMRTELGGIAALLQTLEPEPTPLQRRLDQLGRTLAGAALAIVGVIFVLGLLRGEDLRVLFLTAVSMAVAAVPEGLPAVVTIALALGAQRMLARHALIRKLSAVEALGSVTVICADKTGTLTQNRMTVTVLDVAGERLNLGAGACSRATLHSQPTVALLLAGGALCNDALVEPGGDGTDALRIIGDPTEGALVAAAARLELNKADLEVGFPRQAELPFDSERKRMTTIHAVPALPPTIPSPLAPLWDGLLGDAGTPYIAFTKGAVDQLLAISHAVWVDGHAQPLSSDWRARIQAGNEELAQEGMRVLGVAFRPLPALPPAEHLDAVEHDLIFVGMLGLIDPARAEAQAAVAQCRTAGIRPLMITGDHPLTAQAIARDLGIASDGRILTGPDLDQLPADELERQVDQVAIYARVAPEHKLKIVQALQRRGHVVAMTGDGVNDAPALKQADIGVAMGVSGTDVAREAADMVLRDDNFATIVAAVAEGRVIYDNIRKFVKYLMTSNAGELWAMLLAPLAGMPLPLLPLQILWINLVTDGLPALALSVEPPERSLMQRPPRPPSEPIFAHGMGRHILWVGLLMGLISLGVGYAYWDAKSATWQTMVFMTLTLAQMAHVLAIRSERDSLFRIGLRSNRPLLGAALLTVALQLAVVYVPALQAIFSTVALSAVEVGICVGLSSLIFWAVELEKWLGRRRADLVMEASEGATSSARRHHEREATHG
jgi:Ca2+-transporting ATPase